MSHDHSFGRDATSITWDENEEAIVVSRVCEGYIPDGTQIQVPSGRPSHQEKPCNARKEDVYKIRSIVDSHEYHDQPDSNCILVLDDASKTKNSVRKDNLSEEPDWIDETIEKARMKARDVEAKFFMCHLGGAEISMTLATGDTEYNITMTRVDERVIE